MFLSESDIRELTGYIQPSKQVAWLRQQRIPFHTNRAGHPKVAQAVIEGRKLSEKVKPSWSPSWAASQ